MRSGIFGSVRVFYVKVFTLSEMGDKFPIGINKVGRVCAGGVFYAGGFLIDLLTLSETGDKFTK